MLLERAADVFPSNGITVFNPEMLNLYELTSNSKYDAKTDDSVFMSYAALLKNAKEESKAVQGLLNLNDLGNKVVVLYSDNHLEALHVRPDELVGFLSQIFFNCRAFVRLTLYVLRKMLKLIYSGFGPLWLPAACLVLVLRSVLTTSSERARSKISTGSLKTH